VVSNIIILIYTLYSSKMDLSRRFQERCMLISHLWRKKRLSKKDTEQIFMDVKQQQQEEEEDGFSVVSLDESFFFYDSLVRRAWIDESKRPIVRITGSHKHIHVFWCHKYGWKSDIQTV
jgi:hypothetical protein